MKLFLPNCLLFCLFLFVMGIPLSALTQILPEMISIEGDTFLMGDETNTGEKDELPQQKVWIRPFKMAKTEVTVAQYQEFCTDTKRAMPSAPPWNWLPKHPIVNVSWYDATAYCAWLSKKAGIAFRLPTEAEWEFAARGGKYRQRTMYSGGFEVAYVAWNNDTKTYPVASKYPNELGLYDMSGNAWEWCSDWYGPYSASDKSNPLGPMSGTFKVLRGGSWEDENIYCRVSNRSNYMPSGRNIHNGFRVVLGN